MIFTLEKSLDGKAVLVMDDPWPWIDMIRSTIPYSYVGCWDGYENCIVLA